MGRRDAAAGGAVAGSPRPALPLRIEPADPAGFGHALYTKHVGGKAHVDVAREVDLQYVVEGTAHHLFEAQVDVVLVPEQVILVLHPFEVGDGHAAGVAQDVGNQEHALLVEDTVGFGSDGTV